MNKNLFASLFALAAITANAQFLFRVIGNGLKESSYILGTIHDLPGSLLDNSSEYLEVALTTDVCGTQNPSDRYQDIRQDEYFMVFLY